MRLTLLTAQVPEQRSAPGDLGSGSIDIGALRDEFSKLVIEVANRLSLRLVGPLAVRSCCRVAADHSPPGERTRGTGGQPARQR